MCICSCAGRRNSAVAEEGLLVGYTCLFNGLIRMYADAHTKHLQRSAQYCCFFSADQRNAWNAHNICTYVQTIVCNHVLVAVQCTSRYTTMRRAGATKMLRRRRKVCGGLGGKHIIVDTTRARFLQRMDGVCVFFFCVVPYACSTVDESTRALDAADG